jgi:hypothetical protein
MWAKSKQPSEFRMFVTRMWVEHVMERRDYKQEPLSIEEYFKNYKIWLKKAYKDV